MKKKFTDILEGKDVKKKKKAKGFYFGASEVLKSKIEIEESNQLALKGIFNEGDIVGVKVIDKNSSFTPTIEVGNKK